MSVSTEDIKLQNLLSEVRACRICESSLSPNPILNVKASAKLLIIGQAPGLKVHQTGIPWNDPSGDRLRGWLGIDKVTFYNESNIAIIPMGFCYPGKGKSGDLPPRPECFKHWHGQLMSVLPNIEMTLLIGHYAQRKYLPNTYSSLTENVQHWREFFPEFVPMIHPSPRNTYWLQRNPWFESEMVPVVRNYVTHFLVRN
jgi:uracil-DNA glycosylase